MSHSQDSVRTNHVAVVDVPIRVRYADTDKMGVVYYGTYPVYFEMARSEYMRTKGFTYKEFEKQGYFLVVVDMAAKYHGNAGYDDLLTVKTSIPELKSRGLTFRYEVFKDDTLLVEGHTKHFCINSDKKTVAIPGHLLQILKNAQAE
jgi:acyl-CoA thioester hydrolase